MFSTIDIGLHKNMQVVLQRLSDLEARLVQESSSQQARVDSLLSRVYELERKLSL